MVTNDFRLSAGKRSLELSRQSIKDISRSPELTFKVELDKVAIVKFNFTVKIQN